MHSQGEREEWLSTILQLTTIQECEGLCRGKKRERERENFFGHFRWRTVCTGATQILPEIGKSNRAGFICLLTREVQKTSFWQTRTKKARGPDGISVKHGQKSWHQHGDPAYSNLWALASLSGSSREKLLHMSPHPKIKEKRILPSRQWWLQAWCFDFFFTALSKKFRLIVFKAQII